MFALSSSLDFKLYAHPVDMRKSFDGLSNLVSNDLESTTTNGFVLYYKRLEQGSFELPIYDETTASLTLDYSQLVLLIDGVSITNIDRRKRYKEIQKPMPV